MARKILILSDDDAAQRQAAAALIPLGADLATEQSAEAALERLVGGEADLALIDTDLAGGGGWRVSSDLQRLGAVPVVLLGTRGRQEIVNEIGQQATAYVRKPIHGPELAEAVGHALGSGLVALTPGPARASAPLPTSGTIRDRPAHVVLGDLARRRATGRLDLESGTWKARIHLVDGFVVAATCNDPQLLAGYAQVASGKLSRERLDEALAQVRAARISLHDALRAAGAMTDAELAAAFAAQAAAVVEQGCGLPDGSWAFAPAPPPPPPHARLHPLALADAGVRRAYPAATIRAWLDRHSGERLAAHPELVAMLAAAGIASALPARLENVTAGTLVGRLSASDLALVFTLTGFGLLRFAPVAAEDARASNVGHGAAGSQVLPANAKVAAGRLLTAEERQAIEAEDRRTAASNHYEVLGVAPDAEVTAIKKAFFAAAKRWHSDAFAGRNLDGLAPLVENVFARFSEAHAVLVNPAERAEYDVFLERKAKGLPTDVASVLRAEELFFKALNLFRAQRYADAEGLFRQAVDLNPAEAEFWAYLGASGHRVRGAAAVTEAREAFARARALIPSSLVTEYLEAQLEIGEGELDAAERRLRNILLDKPDHREALRDLRTLRERKEKESATGRGFFGTLLKRK